MWRSMFLAMGVYVALLGAECLAVEQAVLKPQVSGGKIVRSEKVVRPPEWAPWSLMGAGAVIMIYSFTLPKRVKE